MVNGQAGPVKLRRVAKGGRPQYFADPATDKLLVMVLELAQELSVTRDRLDTVERLLDRAALVPASEVDSWLPDADAAAARAERRAAFLNRIFRASEQELAAATVGRASAPPTPETSAMDMMP